jgi:hypothetical protein
MKREKNNMKTIKELDHAHHEVKSILLDGTKTWHGVNRVYNRQTKWLAFK